MLGGGTGTNSNGSNNGNGSPEDRPTTNMVASTRYWADFVLLRKIIRSGTLLSSYNSYDTSNTLVFVQLQKRNDTIEGAVL